MAAEKNRGNTDRGLSQDMNLIKLRLKVLVRTDEAYLVDLGQGKVWIPKSAIKSSRRIDQGILEVEVLEKVVNEKRLEMRKLKEQLTGLKGSIIGEVMELTGEIVKETKDAILIRVRDKEMYIPRVCFSDCEEIGEGRHRFVIQRDYLEFKLRRLQEVHSDDAISTVRAEMLQETDRAFLMKYQGMEIWFPKRAVIEARDLGKEWEFVVATDFWMFKLEKQVS